MTCKFISAETLLRHICLPLGWNSTSEPHLTSCGRRMKRSVMICKGHAWAWIREALMQIADWIFRWKIHFGFELFWIRREKFYVKTQVKEFGWRVFTKDVLALPSKRNLESENVQTILQNPEWFTKNDGWHLQKLRFLRQDFRNVNPYWEFTKAQQHFIIWWSHDTRPVSLTTTAHLNWIFQERCLLIIREKPCKNSAWG